MSYCAVEVVNKGQCNPLECKYNHDVDKSNLRRKKIVKGDTERDITKRMCHKELIKVGSCPFGTDCHFSHDFPVSLRNDPEFVQKVVQQRKERQSICVNEYHKQGACTQGERCRFNHDITDQQRQDPRLQEKMREKLSQIRMGYQIKGSSTDTGARDQSFLHAINKEVADLRKLVLEIKDRKYF